MNKSFLFRWLRAQTGLVIFYLILVGLLALLQYLYRQPLTLLIDFTRFSFPLLVGWLAYSAIHDWHRQQHINHHKPFTPTTPVEQALDQQLFDQRQQHHQLVQQLRQRQHDQLDHLDLFSHEIKNVLAGLQAQAESQPSIASDQVRQSIRQADYYLNLLLNGERLTMDKTDLSLQWVDVASLVDQLIRENAPLFIKKQLRPQVDPFRAQILTDPKWLHFCLNQLLSNAIKYATPGTPIQIRWQNTALQITDTGPAIPASDLPRIYDDGFTGQNGHQTTKSTGMGLYFVRQVAQQLNFQVRVYSPAKGRTTAQLIFPIKAVKH